MCTATTIYLKDPYHFHYEIMVKTGGDAIPMYVTHESPIANAKGTPMRANTISDIKRYTITIA